MIRTRDAEAVDRWVRRDFPGAQSFADTLADELNVCLVEGEGGAIFLWRGPGVYEAHCFFEQRGREVLNLSHRMLDYMRREHGARLFWTAVPDNRKAKIYLRHLGWKAAGFADLPLGHCQLFIGE